MPTKKAATSLLFYVATITLLLLSALNINQFVFQTEDYLTPKDVLGAETINGDQDEETKFWSEFLTKNPNYIPGWIELGDFERIKQIDPNYFLQP